MAQNINPFYSSQNAPSKAAEEKQNIPKDNHAVSKRYANFIKHLVCTLSIDLFICVFIYFYFIIYYYFIFFIFFFKISYNECIVL